MRFRFTVSILVALLAVVGTSAATAQERFGGLAGVVTDTSQAPVPGATITATNKQILTIPIQALTIREFDADPETLPVSPTAVDVTRNKKKIEKEGVFTIKNGVALFRTVKTGITGTTDIEILDGLVEKDEIVTGPYQVLRTL